MPFQQNKDDQWQRAMEYVSRVSELNYMTQVVIMLYEDPTKDASSDERFHVELHFSPGVNCVIEKELPEGPGFRPHSRNHEGSASQHQLQEQHKQQPPDSNPGADVTGPGDCRECGDLDQPSEEELPPGPEITQGSGGDSKPATFVCAFKCSTENVCKMFDAIGNQGRCTEEDDDNDDDEDEDGEVDACDAAPETKDEEKPSDVTQSHPIPIRVTRSKDSCQDCGVEQEVCYCRSAVMNSSHLVSHFR